ncbi:magnesium/cobalt transporter CorA [Bacteroides faecichinchillae]|uniref:Magnesium transport protein CorA n=1 Tax=Bacteroides faecichinchillae TaxID=871325 RepID=A0A1M5FC28_9BACE|nr:magnesium/cobalt transporter CorA [Bacteroides faecichinchillae]THG68506.1 magnesium/cobalt transporter CorA [Bacteroides faecichinchillae]SHF89150.1 magnesium transporter [Bacteroides faecichinchillae]
MKNNLLSEKLIYTGDSVTPTHIHLCTYNATEMQEVSGDTFQSVKNTLDNEKINWLQVHGMKNTETIREICSHFEIDFLVLQDILNANHPTKIEEYEKHIVLIAKLFYPNEHKDENELDGLLQQQVCLVLGNNYVLTFLEKETDFFDDVSSALRNDVLKIRSRQSDYLLSVLLNSVMGNYIYTISSIDDSLEDLEEELLTITNGDDIGIQIQSLRRQYMLMKKVILPLKAQYVKLLRADNLLIHKINRAFYNDVNDHLQFVLQTIEICRETLSSLVDLYISNNDLRMNDIMKRLTVVSTIFIPLTFLVGVWGMNYKWMPELDWRYGYLFAWCLMFIIGIAVYLYFRKKKWY